MKVKPLNWKGQVTLDNNWRGNFFRILNTVSLLTISIILPFLFSFFEFHVG